MFLTHNKVQRSCHSASEKTEKMMMQLVGQEMDVRSRVRMLTSAVRTLIPAVSAVGDSIAQSAHRDAHLRVQAPMFIDRTLVHPVMWAWKKVNERNY